MTLLGDIAHAMVPFRAQGTAQAIGDAAVLGDALAGATSPEVRDALDRYASRRLSTATSVQASCARAGGRGPPPAGGA
ncbi:FAD-dependent monooxygenase [Streptomyces mirabilis]|uniref:FAD-dependent monooxygenase n=1 Tax=Streptomyces mirabilis TaxID=68239 RepID=UPI003F4BA821